MDECCCVGSGHEALVAEEVPDSEYGDAGHPDDDEQADERPSIQQEAGRRECDDVHGTVGSTVVCDRGLGRGRGEEQLLQIVVMGCRVHGPEW
ncbi:MAG: hypothetical protein D8M59_04240 [Planctomycetes bacterium]|nr:hypothetical protein [Planctomycetota bacterium]